MKKAFSIFCMLAATLVMLVMSSIPHHHHCMGITGTCHSEYACCANGHEGSCCSQESSPCHDDEGESTCHLHHITLLIERALSLDGNQYSTAYLVEGILEHDGCQCLEKKDYSKPLSETAISILLTRDKALRAPPALS